MGRGLPTTRRLFLICAGATVIAWPVRAAEFSYKGWRFDIDGVDQPLPDALAQSLRSQIDIVEAVNLKPGIREFFRSVPKAIAASTPTGPGEYDFAKRKMFLSRQIDPPDNPVFLHELLHAYHAQRLPGGRSNPRIVAFFEQAKMSGRFPPDAYMLTNVGEFFAMCVSVVLWGRAARPPRTRAKVRNALPEFYAWILVEFTPDGNA